MKELSLNVLDIAQNSLKAGATLVRIVLEEDAERLQLCIEDNGCGMTKEVLESVVNPFYTTRTTRSVGLGIPLLKLAAEQTGGTVRIRSRHRTEFPDAHGTVVEADFIKGHIDFTPLGDIISTITTLLQGSPSVDFVFRHRTEQGREVALDTRELRAVLGEGISLGHAEILGWVTEYLQEQYENKK